jgi:hypothetical protein
LPHTKRAFDGLEGLLPLFKEKCGEVENLLYVGWCAGKGPGRGQTIPWWHDVFAKRLGAKNIDVLDIFEPNIAELENQVWSGKFDIHIMPQLGDVRTVKNYFIPQFHDVIFVDHVPEHLSQSDLEKTTELLKEQTAKLLVYACPWGVWEQGPQDGNEHERHLNDIYPETLADLGMTVLQYGSPHQSGEGELIAYWIKE